MVDELSFLYNDDEKIKYSRIEEKALIALNNFRAEPVDFLDPFWQEMSVSIAQKYDDLKAIFFGGMDNAENKYLVFCPWYMDLEAKDFISIICFDNPYDDIKHSDVLGKLLSLGIDRRTLGDIFVGEKVYIVVSKSVESFLLTEFRDIRRHGIIPYTVDKAPSIIKDSYKETSVIVHSLRLDAIVSKVYNISRSQAQGKIENGLLKLNYRVVDKPATELKEDSLISLRSFGRVKVKEVVGQTQKGNLRLKVERLI